MSTFENPDILIIGGGVVGIAIGVALLESKPGLKVLISEKEQTLGEHASGRNSGVIHAGFYYSPDSLKAKFCRIGNSELRELCKKYSIPLRETGKVVVTANPNENTRLETLFARGVVNGVDLELLDESKLIKIEPLAKTFGRFLWSPTTAISDPKMVLEVLKVKFMKLGGKFRYGIELNLLLENGNISLDSIEINPKYIVNAAGAQADKIAKQIGLAKEYAMIPFIGVYRATSEKYLPLKTLVYPVPHPVNPFLGVHFTLTLDNKVKIGPTAIPIIGREQYSLFSGISFDDLKETTKGVLALIRGGSHDFSEIIKSEWPKLFENLLVRQSLNLVPSAIEVRNWQKKPPGIRSQLVNLSNGKLEEDFIVRNFLNSTHILNAVSPGWTSALPFGRWVAENYILPNLN